MSEQIQPWPVVSKGFQNHPVQTLQYLLGARGHAVTVDGIFGPQTDAAVRAFQTAKHLAVDGIVGSQTWSALIIQVSQGSTGDAVRGVQEEFQFRNLSGDPSKGLQVDGIFSYAKEFHGLAQIGSGNLAEHMDGAQLGVVNLATEDQHGVQIGVVDYGSDVRGAQLGVVNVAEKVRGVQIGLVNHATSLRGLQIGVVNHAEDGSLVPWSTIINMGFGNDGGIGDVISVGFEMLTLAHIRGLTAVLAPAAVLALRRDEPAQPFG